MSRWLLLSTLLLAACSGPPAPLLLVVEPGATSELQALSASMRDELHKRPGLELRLDSTGCDHGASHQLHLTRQYTDSTSITAVVLTRCVDQVRRVQNFVQPRGSDRDPGRAVAFWVARQLD